MASSDRQGFLATYEWAKGWQELPWAHEEPTLFLAEVCRARTPGRALDLGCGSGTDSVFLASMGWEVTALDFVPKALEYTRQRAAERGLELQLVEADITAWQPPEAYDLVLDHGLLHNLDAALHAAYRERVLQALAPQGDFILVHWHPLFAGQADGRMGPTRRDRATIKAFLAPELEEQWFACEDFADLPDMVGGGMTQACYWFRHNQAWLRPRELLGQLQATLRRHGFDTAAWLADAPGGTSLAPAHLARLVGPGRLGISHLSPDADAAAGLLERWARQAGIDPGEALGLLTAFASPDLAGICVPGAPLCGQCEVRFCRRQRHR